MKEREFAVMSSFAIIHAAILTPQIENTHSFYRIFVLITQLSASPPKSTAVCMALICDLAAEAVEGADETRLKKDI